MKVKRPWGNYNVIKQGKGFKVKLIEVMPHKKLSLQVHKHRSEHWVVVAGEAKITNSKKVYNLKSNESAYISKGQKHRLENPTNRTLKIVEVQSGSYLGEDDIERIEDEFGRR